MAPAADESTLTWATFPAEGVHPAMVPPSVEKMKRAETFDGPTRKPEAPLKTIPVGPPATVTSSPSFVPAALYRVDRSAWLSAFNHGVAADVSTPHPLSTFRS